jgi:hypothetical protein
MALRVVFVLYCIEAGLFFLLAPWTRFWLTNPLLAFSPSIAAAAANPFLRGFVSGFGVVHILLGLREFLEIVAAWRSEPVGRE